MPSQPSAPASATAPGLRPWQRYLRARRRRRSALAAASITLAAAAVVAAHLHRHRTRDPPPGAWHGAAVRVDAVTPGTVGGPVWLDTDRGPVRLAGIAWAAHGGAPTASINTVPADAELRASPGAGAAYRVVLRTDGSRPRTDLALRGLAAGLWVPAGPDHLLTDRYRVAAAAARKSRR